MSSTTDIYGQPIGIMRYRLLATATAAARRLGGRVIRFEDGQYGVVTPIEMRQLEAAGYDLDAVFMD